nr:unnamed protein product [Callosobruchus analis]
MLSSHCVIHRQASASKPLPQKLRQTLDSAIKVLFTLLCEYLDSDHKLLLFHTNVRWLSKANMFSRLHELKEVIIFLEFKEKHDFLTMFKDDIFQWNLFN